MPDRELSHDEPTAVIITTCPVCRAVEEIVATYSGYQKWKAGMLIQDALPELTPNQREKLITGICPKCWDLIFTPAS